MTTPSLVLSGSQALYGVNGSSLVEARAVATGPAATETYLFGVQIPVEASIERQVFRIILWGQPTGNGTLSLRLRAGAPTALTIADANIIHALTTGTLANNMWVRYEAMVTVASLSGGNFSVTGVGEARTGPTVVVGPQNAAEKIVSVSSNSPWYISISGQISTNVFRVRHAAVTAL